MKQGRNWKSPFTAFVSVIVLRFKDGMPEEHGKTTLPILKLRNTPGNKQRRQSKSRFSVYAESLYIWTV